MINMKNAAVSAFSVAACGYGLYKFGVSALNSIPLTNDEQSLYGAAVVLGAMGAAYLYGSGLEQKKHENSVRLAKSTADEILDNYLYLQRQEGFIAHARSIGNVKAQRQLEHHKDEFIEIQEKKRALLIEMIEIHPPLKKMIIENIRATLAAHNFSEDIVDRYLEEMKVFMEADTHGKKWTWGGGPSLG